MVTPSGGRRPTTRTASAPDVPPPAAPPLSQVGVSPPKIFETARGDYFAGQCDLAILGFTDYVKSFPKSDMADDAQVNICSVVCRGRQDRTRRSKRATSRSATTRPATRFPRRYYRKGLALSTLQDVTGARAAWETIVKRFPDSAGSEPRASRRLERLKRP